MSRILSIAQSEHDARRKAQIYELNLLQDLTLQALKTSPISKEIISDSLARDIIQCKSMEEEFEKEDNPFPLKFSKLRFLLEGAKIMLDLHYKDILVGNFEFAPTKEHYQDDLSEDSPYSIHTTSVPNFLQTLLLQILSIKSGTKIDEIPVLIEHKIYDVNISPNIQGVRSDLGSMDACVGFRWITESKGYKELTVPHLGYFFGGSRYARHDYDSYNDKKFKAEDCSSSIAKWAGSEFPFTTEDMLNKSTHAPSDILFDTTPFLRPIGDRDPRAGDIFCFQGHTGIIAEYKGKNAPVKALCYIRFMPFFEGLIYRYYHQVPSVNNPGKVRFISEDYSKLSKLNLGSYYGLDNRILKNEDGSYFSKITEEVDFLEGVSLNPLIERNKLSMRITRK